MKNNRGYTLVELMVGLGIASILAATSTPDLLKWLDNEKVRTAASEITTKIRHCRHQAVAKAIEHRVIVDIINNTVIVDKGNSFSSSTAWSNQIPEMVIGSGPDFKLSFSTFETDGAGKTISEPFPANGILVCKPDGSFIDSAGVMLKQNAHVNVENDARKFKATVVGSRNGRIKLEGPIYKDKTSPPV